MTKVKKISDIALAIDSAAVLDRPLSEWRPILAEECQVYVFGENYIAKRFDQINYKFCEKYEARDILIDNLYALLRYKYFPKSTEEIDEKINKIVSNFTINLKSTLKKVSLEEDSSAEYVRMLPDYCVAFRNGVYNFKDNKWLFKYDITYIETLKNTIYQYDPKWIITWYINLDFEPLPISLSDTSLEEFIELMKEMTKIERNYCFELMYNISHNADDKFSLKRFKHLCQILGYTLNVSFLQYFVILVGSGQNGKNSLMDGCFTHRVIPTPTSNSIESFETDRFISGALENKAHNIYLETSQKTKEFDSQILKNITGSMYQTIECKGIQKYSSIINCKHVFAANDQSKLKFSDTTHGFRRRINVFEIWYRWDAQKRYLKRGDYYETSFSDSLKEIKSNISNVIAYVYFGMYGLKEATQNFENNFRFTQNEWSLTYSDIDIDLKEKIETLSLSKIGKEIGRNDIIKNNYKILFYDLNKTRLYESNSMKKLGYKTYEDMIRMLVDIEEASYYFSENDVYMNVRILQKLIGDNSSAITFTQNLKKIYNLNSLTNIHNNQPYVKVRFINNKITIIN